MSYAYISDPVATHGHIPSIYIYIYMYIYKEHGLPIKKRSYGQSYDRFEGRSVGLL
jgi:hypothetical protein